MEEIRRYKLENDKTEIFEVKLRSKNLGQWGSPKISYVSNPESSVWKDWLRKSTIKEPNRIKKI